MRDEKMQDEVIEPVAEAAAADALGELAEMVRVLGERLDRIEAAMSTAEAADNPAENEDLAEYDERDAAMSELRAEVKRLSDELVRRDATEVVRAVMSEREVGSDAAPLLTEMRIADAGRFDAFISLLPKRSTPKTSRVTGPTTASMSDLDINSLTDGELARKIQADRAASGESILFSTALNEARGMRQGG